MKTFALVGLVALAATPLSARTLDQRIHDLPKLEWAYQAVAVADIVSTEHCLRRHTCHETNVFLDERPSLGTLVWTNVVTGAAHAAVTSALQDHAPKLVRPWELITIGLRGGVVAANLRFAF